MKRDLSQQLINDFLNIADPMRKFNLDIDEFLKGLNWSPAYRYEVIDSIKYSSNFSNNGLFVMKVGSREYAKYSPTEIMIYFEKGLWKHRFDYNYDTFTGTEMNANKN